MQQVMIARPVRILSVCASADELLARSIYGDHLARIPGSWRKCVRIPASAIARGEAGETRRHPSLLFDWRYEVGRSIGSHRGEHRHSADLEGTRVSSPV